MRRLLLTALSVLPLITWLPAPQAQSVDADVSEKSEREELMRLKQEIEKLERQISALREKTVRDNPELQRQRGDVQRLIEEKYRARGYDPVAGQERLQSLQRLYERENLSPQEKRQMATEIANESIAMRNAQQGVLQEEDVQQARAQFSDRLAAALAKSAPETDGLIEKLASITNEYREKLGAAMLRRIGGKP